MTFYHRRVLRNAMGRLAGSLAYCLSLVTFAAIYLATEFGGITIPFPDHVVAALMGAVAMGTVTFGGTFLYLRLKYRALSKATEDSANDR